MIRLKSEVPCTADVCLCDEGRCSSHAGTQWEVLVCSNCEDQAAHAKCANIQVNASQWQCTLCKEEQIKSVTVDFSDSPDAILDADGPNNKKPPMVDSTQNHKEDVPREGTGVECWPDIQTDDEQYQTVDLGVKYLKTETKESLLKYATQQLKKQFNYQTQRNDMFTFEKPYKCDFEGCKSQFTQSSNLKTHKRIHTGEKPYLCGFDGCNARFTQLSNLSAHKRRHTGEKPYKCNFKDCAAAFTQLSALRDHERIHTGEKPYTCNFSGCSEAFIQSSQLKVHQRKHTGSKPCVCNYEGCHAAFAHEATLIMHKRIHKGEKPFKCNYEGCKAAFVQSCALGVHKRIHTGEKPYKCNIKDCNAVFTQLCHLRVHQKKHACK